VRTLVIRLVDDGENRSYVQKSIPMCEYNAYPWSTTAEILHNTVQDLEIELDRQLASHDSA